MIPENWPVGALAIVLYVTFLLGWVILTDVWTILPFYVMGIAKELRALRTETQTTLSELNRAVSKLQKDRIRRFRLVGTDIESGMQTEVTIDAADDSDAMVVAKRMGIIPKLVQPA